MRWVGREARMGEMKHTCKKSIGEGPFVASG